MNCQLGWTKNIALMAMLMLPALVCSVSAQTVTKTLSAGDISWTTNPAMPKGIQSATLIGDPSKTGDVVVQRVKLPPHAEVPLHTHPFAETITVISGEVGFGLG